MHRHVERVVDLLDPSAERLHASARGGAGAPRAADPTAVRGIDGSFALVAQDGITVRLARSLDRPDALLPGQAARGPGALRRRPHRHAAARRSPTTASAGQFHPELHAHGARPLRRRDPRSWAAPIPTRPTRASSRRSATRCRRTSTRSAGATSARWRTRSRSGCGMSRRARRGRSPIGVAFSGGIDSGAVFLVTYHVMLRLGLSPARLKAFVLEPRRRPGPRAGARVSRSRSAWRSSSRTIDAGPADLDLDETLRVLEDYKPLDVECAAMGLALCRGIRARYPEWRHLADGDGGDENLKDYPDRREPRAHDPQRRRQPDALPGGLGRRPHQALAHLQRRAQPQLRADLRARAPLRLRRLQPVHAARASSRSPKAFRSRRSPATTCRRSTRSRARSSRRGVQGRHRARHAGLPEAPLPARRDAEPRRCARGSAPTRAAYRRAFHALYA